jgi:anti-anti-sigma factor
MGLKATTDAGDPVYFVSIEEVDAATVRAFDVELDAAMTLYRSTGARASSPPATLIIDLGQIRFLDSRGLQSLLRVHREVTAEGGQVRLRNARGVVRRVLEVTGALALVNGDGDEIPTP